MSLGVAPTVKAYTYAGEHFTVKDYKSAAKLKSYISKIKSKKDLYVTSKEFPRLYKTSIAFTYRYLQYTDDTVFKELYENDDKTYDGLLISKRVILGYMKKNKSIKNKLKMRQRYIEICINNIAKELCLDTGTVQSKLLRIEKYIASSYTYKKRKGAKFGTIDYLSSNKYNGSLYHILKYKAGKCEDFSLLYKKLCEKSGIKCKIIRGTVYPDKSPEDLVHSWNAVYIDGVFRYKDITWDLGNTSLHWCEGVTTEEFEKQHFMSKKYF